MQNIQECCVTKSLFKVRLWTIIYIFVLLDQGGLYKRTTYFLLLASLFFLYWRFRSGKRLLIFQRSTILLKGLIYISGLVSALQGIDKGDSIYGMIKLTAIFLTALGICQCDEGEKMDCLKRLPYVGVIAIALGAGRLPFIKNWISATGRLAGAFAYPNTMALFLLLGLIVLEQVGKKGKRCIQAILCFGIFLTGSRAGFLILCGYLAYACWKQKEINRVLILVFIGLLGIVHLLSAAGINLLGMSRFLTVSTKASTFQGRLLYWQDAITMLCSQPLGLGYMGYFYIQQAVQTGIYSVRFVHNDWIQLMLDYGIPAGIAAMLLYAKEILSPKAPVWKKECLVIIGLYSAFDFHLQFWGILLLILFFSSPAERVIKENQVKTAKRLCLAGIFAAIVLSGCFVCAGYYADRGDYQSAVKLVPFSTEYKQQLMLQAEDLESANRYADEVLKGNLYAYAAYKIKANAAAKRGELISFLENENEALALNKYDMEEYEEYFQILLILYQKSAEKGNQKEMRQCIQAMLQIPLKIEEVKRETNIRAYLIQEKPKLYFNKGYEKMIDTLRGEISNEWTMERTAK